MLFFFIFLALVLCGMGYVLWHVWCVLPFPKVVKWVATIVMAACLLSMFIFLGGTLERMPLNLASICYEVSTSAIIVLLYLFLLFIVADIARLFHLLPAKLLHLTAGVPNTAASEVIVWLSPTNIVAKYIKECARSGDTIN